MCRFILLLLILIMNSYSNASIIFNYSQNDQIFIGSNLDCEDAESIMWFIGNDSTEYGRVYFGFSDRKPGSGMNDQGLVIGKIEGRSYDSSVQRNRNDLLDEMLDNIMAECSTVKEALGFLNENNLESFQDTQVMFTDKHCNSVIVTENKIDRNRNYYQIMSDLNPAQNNKSENISSFKYKIAENMIKSKGFSQDLIRNILAATHQEGIQPTQISNIFDPVSGLIYLYHFHNYENTVRINLKEALKQENSEENIANLFPQLYSFLAYKEDLPTPIDQILLNWIDHHNIDFIISKYNELKNDYQKVPKYDFKEEYLYEIADYLLQNDRIGDAILIYTLSTEEYPESWEAYFNLAIANIMMGDNEKALGYLKKSLTLSPQNDLIKLKIKELELD